MAIPNPAFNPDEEDNLDIPEHLFIRKRKVRLSRSAFAAVCSLVLAGVFAWCAGWLGNEGGLWVLSGGVGALYGALFTLTVSSAWSSVLHDPGLGVARPGIIQLLMGLSPRLFLRTLDRRISV